jgi:hypothetical protein
MPASTPKVSSSQKTSEILPYAAIPPTRRPTRAVTAIANPPPTHTRTAARIIGAPPARAPAIPSAAKARRALTTTAAVRYPGGKIKQAAIGKTAPAVKLSAEYTAACTGRAWIAAMPSSSRAWAPSASEAVSASATLPARSIGQPTLHVDRGQLLPFALWMRLELSALLVEVGLLNISLRADGHIFPSGHRHRPGDQSGDCRREHEARRGSGCNHADRNARDGDDSIIGTEHSGS